MKRYVFTLMLAAGCCLALSGQTPSTSLDYNFNSGQEGNWYDWAGEMTFSFTGGEMQVAINRTLLNNWDRFVLWVNPFDIGPDPYFSMKISSDVAIPMTITFKDTAGISIVYPVDLTGGGTWDEIFVNMTDQLGSLDYTILAEVQFDPSPGTALAANLSVDDVKMGAAATPQLSPPTVDPVSDLLVGRDAGPQAVALSGITNGGDGDQALTISATSDNTELIPTLSVDYSYPETTGSINFTPAAGMQGEATITVTLTDEGALENETEMSFRVLVMEYGGSGFTDDFEAAQPDTLWDMPNPRYALFQSEGVLRVDADKRSGWESFSRRLPGFMDLSENPVLNLDVKGERPFILHVYLQDAEGNTDMQDLRIMNTDKFVTASFDFSDASGIKLDRITGLIFAFNGHALSFTENVWFDNLSLGSAAGLSAYLAAIPDHLVYPGAAIQEQVLTDVTHASGLTVSGQDKVAGNLQLSDLESGKATLSYEIKAGASGMDTITVTALGLPGYGDYDAMFSVSVEENIAPVADPLEDLRAAVGQEVEVTLSGIDDGNASSEQEISLSAGSDNAAVLPDEISVDYASGPYAKLSFTPASAGMAEITVILADDGGPEEDTALMSFMVEVFESINQAPTIDQVESQGVYNDESKVSINLTGISDGDDGTQNLVLSAESSVDSIIADPLTIEYTGGSGATLSFVPNPSHTGTSTITVKVVDDGAATDNNGNDSVYMAFEVETRSRPLTGWVVPLDDPGVLDLVSAEQEGVAWFISTEDSGSFHSMKLELVDKWDFGGMWMDLPVELDLTDFPYISYEVYPVGSTLSKKVDGVSSDITDTYHWNYFYDNNNDRNILNSGDHMFQVEPDRWTTLSFDYSDPGDMQTQEGEEILRPRIVDILFNLHWRQGAWPFTDMSGTVYYRNIRIGDQAVIPARTPVVSMDPVAGQARYTSSGEYTVTLTGISDGAGSAEGVSITAYSGRSSVIPDPVVSEVNPDGTATLTYVTGEKTGTSPMVVTVTADGSEEKRFTFDVDIVSTQVEKMALVEIDREASFQTMEGMGTFENEERWIEMYVDDMGASAVRIGLISKQIEPVNDNHDPYVLDMKALNYDAIKFDYFRKLKEHGVETFILTSWSPPAWMKTNLSEDWMTDNAEQSTLSALNRLDFHQYEEFAESMVAVVRMFEQEAGIYLDAIGLQNEPAFDEPYASAILDPFYFAKLITVVGQRFEEEGITTRLYMPEQVVGQWANSNAMYLDMLQNNAEANPLCDIFAVHGYGEDGIQPGQPSYSEWRNMYNQAQQGDYPKDVWMTETHIGYQGWSSAISNAGAIHGGLWAGNVSFWANWSFGDMQLTKNVPNSTFYTSKNYFKYIRPGAVRKGSQSDHPDVLATAFEHEEDGTFTVVLVNKGNNPVSVDLAGNNLPNIFSAFRTSENENFLEMEAVSGEMFILPASSVTTLYATENLALTMDDVGTQYLYQDDPEQALTLSGISDGSGGVAGLSLEVETDDPDLLTGIEVSGVQADGTASLSFTPGAGLSGSALVRVSLSDGSQTREVKFYVVVESTVGTREREDTFLKVYPNPAKERLMVELPSQHCEVLEMKDITGRTIIHTAPGAVSTVELSLESVDPGIYLLLVRSEGQSFVARVIVE